MFCWRPLCPHMRVNSTRVLAHLAMLFVTCTFSLWNVLGELVLKRGLDPIVLATYRELGTATLLLIGSVALNRGSNPRRFRPDMRQAALFVACGVGGVYGLQLFYVLGLARTDANTAALFQPLVPVLVLLLSSFLGIERLRLHPCGEATVRRSWQKLAGVVLACAGCLIVVRASNGGGGGGGGGGGETGGSETGGETGGARQLGLVFLLVSDLGAATFIVSQVGARRHTPNQLRGMHHSMHHAPCHGPVQRDSPEPSPSP
jgi:drug/metabolite transporter (DMT)-like permease